MPRRPRWLPGALVLALPLLHGCAAPSGTAKVEIAAATGAEPRLETKFVVAAFVVGPAATAIYMSDVPLEALLDGSATTAQVAHFELLWRPIAGQTPFDDDATNASIRHVVLVDGEVGIFGGAGFVTVKGDGDSRRIRVSTEGATIGLLDASPGFLDLLSPAVLDADIVAVNDEALALRIRQAVSQRVTDAFGAPRFVAAPTDDGTARAALGTSGPDRSGAGTPVPPRS